MFTEIFFWFLITVALGYSVIISVIIVGLCFRKKSPLSKEKKSTTITVIIPARNEVSRMAGCLQALLVQDYPRDLFEVIIVDDSSVDGTGDVIRSFISDNPGFPVRMIRNEGPPSKKNAILKAIAASAGELIITSDADSSGGPGWISCIAGFYESYHPEMIIAPVDYTLEKNLFSALQSLEFMGLIGATAGSAFAGDPLMCNGANLAYKRQAFAEVNGFSGNEKYASGDDQFLMMKIRKKYGRKGVRFLFDKGSVVKTPPASTIVEFYHQRLRWVSKSTGYTDKKVLGVAVMTYLVNLAIFVAFFIPGMQLTAVLIFFVKMILDFIPVTIMSVFFKKKKLLFLFPLAEILNILYTLAIGFAGLFSKYKWKGMIVKPVRA